jgi:hypothetical protein
VRMTGRTLLVCLLRQHFSSEHDCTDVESRQLQTLSTSRRIEMPVDVYYVQEPQTEDGLEMSDRRSLHGDQAERCPVSRHAVVVLW